MADARGNRVASGGLRRLRALVRERRAVTAVEWAIAGPVFLLALTALFELGYLFFVQLLVDEAAQTIARQIQTGQAQQQTTQTGLNSTVLCPALTILPCGNLYVYLQAVSQSAGFGPTSGYTVPTTGSAADTTMLNCTPGAGQLIQLNVTYMAPVFLARMFPSASGGKLPIHSAAAFGDEDFGTTVSNECS